MSRCIEYSQQILHARIMFVPTKHNSCAMHMYNSNRHVTLVVCTVGTPHNLLSFYVSIQTVKQHCLTRTVKKMFALQHILEL